MIFESLADKEGGKEQYKRTKRGLLCRRPLLHITGWSEWGTQPGFWYFQGNALKSFKAVFTG